MIRRAIFYVVMSCIAVAIWQACDGQTGTLTDRTWTLLQSGGNVVREVWADLMHPTSSPTSTSHVRKAHPAPHTSPTAKAAKN